MPVARARRDDDSFGAVGRHPRERLVQLVHAGLYGLDLYAERPSARLSLYHRAPRRRQIGVHENGSPPDPRHEFFEQLYSLRVQLDVSPVQAREVPPRPRQTGDEPLCDGVVGRKHNGNRLSGRLGRDGRGVDRVTITSTLRRTNSVAFAWRSGPSRNSKATFWPSTHPRSRSPSKNESNQLGYGLCGVGVGAKPRRPIRAVFVTGCASSGSTARRARVRAPGAASRASLMGSACPLGGQNRAVGPG